MPTDDHDINKYQSKNIDINYFASKLEGGKKNKGRSSSQTKAQGSSQKNIRSRSLGGTKAEEFAADKTVATAEFLKLQSVLDSYATKGLVSKNTAARKKSRLSAKIKAL